MPNRGTRRDGKGLTKKLFPVFLCALTALPNSPLLVSTLAQSVGTARAVPAIASAGAAAASATAPAPFSLTPLTVSAPLAAPIPAPSFAAPPAVAKTSVWSALATSVATAGAPALHTAPTAHDGAKPHREDARSATVTTLRGIFRPGSRAAAENSPENEDASLSPLFDGKQALKAYLKEGVDSGDSSNLPEQRIKFYIAEQGKPTLSGNFRELERTLKDHPEVAARLNIIRLAIAKKDRTNPHDGLVPEDASRIGEQVRALGVKAKLEVEHVPVDWQRHEQRKNSPKDGDSAAADRRSWKEKLVDAAAHPIRTVFNVATWPAREAAFVVKTYLASVSAPTRQELIGAALTKIPPFIVGVGIWWKMIGPAHPILLAAAIGLSFAWEAFHGVLLNSWNSFQNSLYKLRGGTYQTNFNWVYGQLNPAIFRLMSWSVDHSDPNRVPPWHLKYWFSNWNPLTVAFWFAMGPISVVGTFIGTLAYRGLNTLYETGHLTRTKRSYIQQGRDFVMMLTGFLLGAGMAKYYVLFFLAQQVFDVGAYVVSLRAKGRPVLYVTDDTVASTKEFNELYPVAPNPVVEPPLKQALKSLGDIPLLYPITLPIKLGRRLWSMRKKR